MKLDDIVAYTYRADIYGPECIIAQLIKAGLTTDTYPAYAAGAGFSVEYQLDDIAEYRGIDRQDERSFDSGDFPKVVFRDQLEGEEHCAQCGREI